MNRHSRDTHVTLWVEPAQEAALAASAPTPIQQLELALAAEGYRFYEKSVKQYTRAEDKFDHECSRYVECLVNVHAIKRSFHNMAHDSKASYTYEMAEYIRESDLVLIGVSERVTEVDKTGPSIPYRDGLDVGLTSKRGGYYR